MICNKREAKRLPPFQDGNGRVGRPIMFKKCLKHGIVPFIIEDKIKMFYYRGVKEWNQEKGYLTDTCLFPHRTTSKGIRTISEYRISNSRVDI